MDFRKLILQIKEEGSKVLVVGLGISGIETGLFLRRMDIPVIAVERENADRYKAKSKFGPSLSALESAGAKLHFGTDGEGIRPHLEGVKLAVLSPGVSLESAVAGTLKRAGVPFVSELELAIALLGWPCIAVTGSNGKTTTVSLIHAMLTASGMKATLCGNVGVPVISSVQPEHLLSGAASEAQTLVVEASSYQLESCTVLRPKVGVLLDLSDNHLERHGSMQRYFDSKARMFQCQTAEDFAVINAEDTWSRGLQRSLPSKVALFGTPPNVKSSAWRSFTEVDPKTTSEILHVSIAGKEEQYSLERCRLLGAHNRANLAASALGARLMGATQSGVQRAIDDFVPLTHRLEPLGEVQGVLYINDSKSTTVAASVAALDTVLQAFPGRQVTLMIGGLAKAGSWEPLFTLIERHKSSLRPILCFGQDARILANHCKAHTVPHQVADTLQSGVELAARQAKPNELVLLSPGCASFDQFTDFEQRGDVFKSLVAAQVA
jgi:UDP-N-acetylmuramoylalanine--D-glutamate ligase